ncbi:hypothetical protein H2204_007424 [Knufia peltigerae]|uniref:Uncharacterized protein n=1 Tax=Knufia peltigerae TaxID=1002370 RepID=A0AA39CXX6_9EURO|nr:hypothetical protein H2204_007424 [Knufia peltigerae]
MSAEKVTEQAQRCLDIVKACTSPWKGLLTIQKDLDTLIQRGCSRSPSPSPAPEDLPGGTQRQPSGPASSQQMFSRHSLIKRIGIVDDSDNLSMPPLSQAASTSTPSIAQSGLQRSTGFDTDTTAVGDMQTVEVALVQDPLFAVVPSTPIRGSDAFDGALDCPLRLPGSFGLYPWDWPCEPWPARYDLPAPSMGPDNFSGNMWTNWTT